MSTFFMDTSAIIKRYALAEPGSSWTIALCEPSAGHKIVLSQATLVEAVAAICRKGREPDRARRITEEELERLIKLFRQDSRQHYYIINVTTPVYNASGDLCRIHNLRAYDAVQRTCALAARQKESSIDQTPFVFVSADNKLLEMAKIEGLDTENPNNYP